MYRSAIKNQLFQASGEIEETVGTAQEMMWERGWHIRTAKPNVPHQLLYARQLLLVAIPAPELYERTSKTRSFLLQQ